MSTKVFADRRAMRPVWSRPATRSPRSDLWGDAFACFIPMLMFIEVELVGRLFLSEILLLSMLPFLLMGRGRVLLAPLPRKLLLLGFAWLLSQILTDGIRGTPFEDWSRGWSKIVFLLLNFSAIYLYLDGKEKRFFLFALGIALGQILAYFLNPNIYAADLPWKFGYGMAVTLLVVLASQMRVFERTRLSPSAIVMGAGILNFYMGFRSLGLICLLAGWFVWLKQSNRFGLKKMRWSRVSMLLLLGGVAIYAIAGLYEYGASEGWLGDDAREKYLTQTSGDMGLLLGARNEILASAQAIKDSPVIGHGSWAKDPKYADILVSALGQHGYAIQGESESDLIPSHSYIMGAWVEAGFVGAIFWFWALLLTARALIATQAGNSPLALLIAFVAFNLLWNIPFSPFGAEARLYTAYYLSLIMFAFTLSRSSIAQKRPT